MPSSYSATQQQSHKPTHTHKRRQRTNAYRCTMKACKYIAHAQGTRHQDRTTKQFQQETCCSKPWPFPPGTSCLKYSRDSRQENKNFLHVIVVQFQTMYQIMTGALVVFVHLFRRIGVDMHHCNANYQHQTQRYHALHLFAMLTPNSKKR